jgi:hypothetical protein
MAPRLCASSQAQRPCHRVGASERRQRAATWRRGASCQSGGPRARPPSSRRRRFEPPNNRRRVAGEGAAASTPHLSVGGIRFAGRPASSGGSPTADTRMGRRREHTCPPTCVQPAAAVATQASASASSALRWTPRLHGPGLHTLPERAQAIEIPAGRHTLAAARRWWAR